MAKISPKAKKGKVKKSSKEEPTTAIQLSDGSGARHAVGIWDLHVSIVPDGRFWFAQGLEIDYAVQGDSIEDAKRNFEIGLELTIDHHLTVDGNIGGLLVSAPVEMIQEALKNRLNGSIQTYAQVSLHDVGKQTSSLPFDGISYLVSSQAA